MNRTTQYFMGLGAAVIVLAVSTMAVLNTPHPAVTASRAMAEAPAVFRVSAPEPAPAVPPESQVIVPPLPANATTVPDEDLLRLSALVDLPNASDHSIDKDRWAQVVPIAEKLVQGPCDCEQRNWLNHFIAMGEAARSGEDEQYHQLAGLMVKLARNDKQLADDPVRSLR